MHKKRQFGGRRLYKLAAWRRLRDAVIARDGGICVVCRIRACEIVHHIVHIDEETELDPRISLNQENLICVCRQCHGDLHNTAKSDDVVFLPDGSVRSTKTLTADDFLKGADEDER